MEGRIVLAGDLNVKFIEWGMQYVNSKGKRIMQMAARQRLIVLNNGTSTFRRSGQRITIPDIILALQELVRYIAKLKVNEDYKDVTIST